MIILCCAFIEQSEQQLIAKLNNEVLALRRTEAEVYGFIFGRSCEMPVNCEACTYIEGISSKELYCTGIEAVIESLKPDVVYFRYPPASEALLHFLERHNNIVFEHNTIEIQEFRGNTLENERKWGSACVSRAAGLCCVTREILDHQLLRAGHDIPCAVMGNGIAVETRTLLKYRLPDDDSVHMVCAAEFSEWHGIDRLLYGMAAYKGPRRLVLHLAGVGPAIRSYEDIVAQTGLHSQVVFHGFLRSSEMDKLVSTCHVGVGSLGNHRRALSSSAALKHRQYCLQGLPFFFAGADEDFSDSLPFLYRYPADDSALDVTPIIRLADAVRAHPELRREMRAYGEEHLSWSVKGGIIRNLLDRVVANLPKEEGQTQPALSIVVIDTGEPLQRTMDSLRHMAAANPHFHCEFIVAAPGCPVPDDGINVVVAQGGRAELLNAGIRAAHGQWVLPLEAGDTVSPELPGMLHGALARRPELSAIGCSALDMQGSPCRLPSGAKGLEMPGGLLFRRSLAESMRVFDVLLPSHVIECAFWLRIVAGAAFWGEENSPCITRYTQPGMRSKSQIDAASLLVLSLPEVFSLDSVLHAQQRIAECSEHTREWIFSVQAKHPDEWMALYWKALSLEQLNMRTAINLHIQAANLCGKEWEPFLRLYMLYRATGDTESADSARRECLNRGLRYLFS